MSDPSDNSYQDKRRKAIEDAAYAVLAEKGYKAASMLAIARRAKASNETLYNWYGNKQKLFGSLVDANTADLRALLKYQHTVLATMDIEKAMVALGSLLLEVVTGDRAVALNRAAAGDIHDTGTLGKTIAQSGRQTILPLVAALFSDAKKTGALKFTGNDKIEEVWASLLIGDLQIQRVIGVCDLLSKDDIAKRSNRAAKLVMQLYAT